METAQDVEKALNIAMTPVVIRIVRIVLMKRTSFVYPDGMVGIGR